MVCVCSSDDLVNTDTHPLVLFPCGLTAGCLAAMVTHPADVIKTHLQLKQAQRGATRLAVYNILQV